MTDLVTAAPIQRSLGKLDQSTANGKVLVDALIAFLQVVGPNKHAYDRLLEFFTAQIPNQNTRAAYCRAARDFFTWCQAADLGELVDIEPVHIAAYLEQIGKTKSAPTVKQNLQLRFSMGSVRIRDLCVPGLD